MINLHSFEICSSFLTVKSIDIKIGGFKSSDQFWNQAAGGNGTASGEGGKVNRAPAKRSSHSLPEQLAVEYKNGDGDFFALTRTIKREDTIKSSFFEGSLRVSAGLGQKINFAENWWRGVLWGVVYEFTIKKPL